jgi:hypothetical protein
MKEVHKILFRSIHSSPAYLISIRYPVPVHLRDYTERGIWMWMNSFFLSLRDTVERH